MQVFHILARPLCYLVLDYLEGCLHFYTSILLYDYLKIYFLLCFRRYVCLGCCCNAKNMVKYAVKLCTGALSPLAQLPTNM
jgi:hypothetical protein